MSLMPCPFCGEQVADQKIGVCPKCGGQYEGVTYLRQIAAEKARLQAEVDAIDAKWRPRREWLAKNWAAVVLAILVLGCLVAILWDPIASLI